MFPGWVRATPRTRVRVMLQEMVGAYPIAVWRPGLRAELRKS